MLVFLMQLLSLGFEKFTKNLDSLLVPRSRWQCHDFGCICYWNPSLWVLSILGWIKKWFAWTVSTDCMANWQTNISANIWVQSFESKHTSQQIFEFHVLEQIFESNSFKGSHCIRPDRDPKEGARGLKIFTNQCKSAHGLQLSFRIFIQRNIWIVNIVDHTLRNSFGCPLACHRLTNKNSENVYIPRTQFVHTLT